MTSFTRRIERTGLWLSLLLLVALTAQARAPVRAAAFPPGPYRPIAAQNEPVPPIAPAQTATRLFLPIVGPGAPATPDLSFSPAELTLAPGATVATTVTVNPAADLRGATFQLLDAGEGVTTSFAAAADGASGTLTIAAAADATAGEQTHAVNGTSALSGTTWTGNLRLTVAGATATTRFVNPSTGSDAADGTQSRPFKTLRKALSVAKAGDLVKLAAGSYTKNVNGDTYPLLVPTGVTIQGTLRSGGAKESFLSPVTSAAQELGLTFAGDATVKDLEMDVFGTAIQATKGKLTLSNLNLILNRVNVDLTGSAQASLTNNTMLLDNVANVRGVTVADQAQVTMFNDAITSDSENCGNESGIGIILSDTAQATIKSVQLKNIPGQTLLMGGTSKALLTFVNIERTNAAGCMPRPLVQASNAASLTLQGIHFISSGGQQAHGIRWNSTGPLTIGGSSLFIRLTGSAIQMQENAPLAVDATDFSSNGTGIDTLSAPRARLTITNSRFGGNTTGIIARNLKLRTSTVRSNFLGIVIIGSGANLGTLSDPGKNTFDSNSRTGVEFRSQLTTRDTLNAAGNTWNPNIQNADGGGTYPAHPLVNDTAPSANGTNFRLVGLTQIQF